MTIIVEDGSVVEDANSYASLDDCADYCAARGLTFPSSPSTLGEQALIRATAAIDAIYGGRFPGYKLDGREQSLAWPRGQAYDNESLAISDDAIPGEIFKATCEAAVRELATPNSVLPDLERAIKNLKAGSVSIEYESNSSSAVTFQLIDGILAPILVTGSGGGLFGVAVRG